MNKKVESVFLMGIVAGAAFASFVWNSFYTDKELEFQKQLRSKSRSYDLYIDRVDETYQKFKF
jgi:hypothetical protein